jgi:hypothetical protein
VRAPVEGRIGEAASVAFTAGLKCRMHALGVRPNIWSDRACLDASLRLAHTLIEAGKLKGRRSS